MRRVAVLVFVFAVTLSLCTVALAGPSHTDPDDTTSRVDIATVRMRPVPGFLHRRVIVITTYEDMHLHAGNRRLRIQLDTRRGPGFDVVVNVEYDGASAGLTCYVGTRGTPDPRFEPRRCHIGPRTVALGFDVWPQKRIHWRVLAEQGVAPLTSMVVVDRAPDTGWYGA